MHEMFTWLQNPYELLSFPFFQVVFQVMKYKIFHLYKRGNKNNEPWGSKTMEPLRLCFFV